MQQELETLAAMENVSVSEESSNIQHKIQFNEPEVLRQIPSPYEQIEPNRTGKIIGIILLLLFVAVNTISINWTYFFQPNNDRLLSAIFFTHFLVILIHVIANYVYHTAVSYWSFAIPLYLDIIVVGGIVTTFLTHCFIYSIGKLFQHFGDSNFFFVYIRFINHSTNFGIFIWCMYSSCSFFFIGEKWCIFVNN